MNRPAGFALMTAASVIGIIGFEQKCSAYNSTLDNAMLEWTEGQNTQIFNDEFLETPSYLRNDSTPAEIGWSDTIGRVRLTDTGEYSPTVAFEAFYMNLNSHSPLLPRQLNDQSVAVGTPIGQFGDWGVSVAVGAGYAGNSPYNDSNAVYALAQITALDHLTADDQLYVSVDYDGNRDYLPDAPLPSVEFEHTGKTFQWTVGLPYESFHWQATSQLQISGEYDPVTDGFADVDYALLQWLHIYGHFESDSWFFHLSNYNPDQRFYMSLCRVEGGFRINTFNQHLSVQLSGGYAFDQEVGQGYDYRDEHNFGQVANAPYADMQIQFTF